MSVIAAPGFFELRQVYYPRHIRNYFFKHCKQCLSLAVQRESCIQNCADWGERFVLLVSLPGERVPLKPGCVAVRCDALWNGSIHEGDG